MVTYYVVNYLLSLFRTILQVNKSGRPTGVHTTNYQRGHLPLACVTLRAMTNLTVTPLTGAIGAEITGIDLKSMSAEEESTLEQAFLDHLVVCIRDQELTPADLLDLTRQFGGIGETQYLTGLQEYPDVVPVIKEADGKSPHSFGAGWHTDFTG
jgi:hypothetical protein